MSSTNDAPAAGEPRRVRNGYTPCDWPECERSVATGWALFRVNATGQPGIFMCSEHAGASPEEVADLMDRVASAVASRPEDGTDG